MKKSEKDRNKKAGLPNKSKALRKLSATEYLMSTEANRKRIDEAIAEIKSGTSVGYNLIEQ